MTRQPRPRPLARIGRALALSALLIGCLAVTGSSATAAATPTGLTASQHTASSVRLSWAAVPGAVRYRVWYGVNANGTKATKHEVTTASATLTGLTPGTTYYADVASIDASGRVSAYTPKLAIMTTSTASATPAGLTLQSRTATSLTLTWNAATGAARYRLWYGVNANGTKATKHEVTTTTATLTGLTRGTTYYVDVASIDSSGRVSAYSPKLAAATPSVSKPTGLTAKATNAVTGEATWSASPGADYHRVYYGLNADGTGLTKLDVRGASKATLPGLTPSTTYYVKVAGKTDDGQGSDYTANASFTTPAMATPKSLTAARTSETAATVTWQAVPGTSFYRIWYGANADGTGLTRRDVASGTSTTLTGLPASTTTYVKIAAFPAKGEASAYSENAVVAPATPRSVAATDVRSGSTTLTWQASPATRFYRIYYGTRADGTGRARLDVTGDPRQYLDGLAPNTTYYARIAAFGLDGSASAYAEDVVIKTPALTTATERLNVATYNVFGSGAGPAGNPWGQRKQHVWNIVNDKNPMVLGLQEAGQSPVNGVTSSGYFWFDQVVEGMRNPSGTPYLLVNRHAYNCQTSYSPAHQGDGSKRCYGAQVVDQGASRGTRIAYDPDQVVLLSSGSRLLSDVSETQGTVSAENYKDRYMAWAVFSQKNTGKRFFFVNTHLHDNDHAKRILQAGRLRAAIPELNTDNLPVILLGDFNIHPWADGTGWNDIIKPFNDAGYTDLLGTRSRSNVRTDTKMGTTYTGQPNCDSFTGFRTVLPLESNPINGEKDCWRSGYDQVEYNGNNIDYIFTKGISKAPIWETVIRIDDQGRMLDPIASDHNMLRAEVVLP